MNKSLRYDLRGVSASKSEVHAAIKHLSKGLYPNAFCKILPDVVGGSPEFCNIMHADTAGTKTSLAYIYWKETGDLSVWEGVVQDAIVMNLDDMACVGCIDNIVLSSTIARNKHLISGDVIATIIQSTHKFAEMLAQYGIQVFLAGGETADVGDIVRTIDVGYTTFARMPREQVLVNHIRPGDVVVGLASFGKSKYETAYNSGIGSNGLTSARHDVFSHQYADRYPESFDPNTDSSVIYNGSRLLTDTITIANETTTIGKLVLSPTRTYLPVMKAMFETLRPHLHGLIHCTGGAQTKVLKFVQNCHIIKDNLFPVPPLFDLIKTESGTDWQEMYQVFNMGHRLEIYLPEEYADHAIQIAQAFGVDAQVIGWVEKHAGAKVSVKNEHGVFQYVV